MGLFDWIRKKDGEEVKQVEKGKDIDYFRIQEMADEIEEPITVRIAGGQEIVIMPHKINDTDEGKYAW